jgi:CubicO group peptidase (beta-lactamase class C family)
VALVCRTAVVEFTLSVLCAKLIENVSKKPFGQFLEERIFKPLNMSATKDLTVEDLPNAVQGYTGENLKDPVKWNPDWARSAGPSRDLYCFIVSEQFPWLASGKNCAHACRDEFQAGFVVW